MKRTASTQSRRFLLTACALLLALPGGALAAAAAGQVPQAGREATPQERARDEVRAPFLTVFQIGLVVLFVVADQVIKS